MSESVTEQAIWWLSGRQIPSSTLFPPQGGRHRTRLVADGPFFFSGPSLQISQQKPKKEGRAVREHQPDHPPCRKRRRGELRGGYHRIFLSVKRLSGPQPAGKGRCGPFAFLEKGDGMTEQRTLAIGNQKGGVGKTTTALNLGVELVNRGRTVVLVDADPQHSLTTSLGVDAAESSLAEDPGRPSTGDQKGLRGGQEGPGERQPALAGAF